MTPQTMNRRRFLQRASAAASLVAGQSALPALAAKPSGKPNLLILLGEGARPDECSLAGNKLLHTPAIDRIGREGVVFQNSFVTNALCVPGRASVLTGTYGHTNGAVSNMHAKVKDSVPLLSDMLRANGYEIAFIGKSHVEGALRDHYWDYYFGFNGQADYQHPKIFEGRKGKFGEPTVFEGTYVDDLLAERAVSWLQEPHDKPVCLFLWFYAPHAPFVRPLRKVDEYNGVRIPKPSTFDEYKTGYKGKPKGVVDAYNKVGFQFWGNDHPRSLEELVKDHYAGIETNDEGIAKVFQVLEAKKMMDDTAVIWSSDHGFFLGEHRFYDKRLMYEPSIRVPMMIRYPKRIKPNISRQEMVLNIDIAPTVLDIAGIPIPEIMQGRSMMPLAEGRQVPSWRKDWLYEYYEYPGFENVPPARGVRTERYKYIDYFTTGDHELYDLKIDPDEANNLYGDPKYSAIVSNLKARLTVLRQETNDNYEYVPSKVVKAE